MDRVRVLGHSSPSHCLIRWEIQTGHDKVKKKGLMMIQNWATEWENDPTLSIMNECYQSLKAKSRSQPSVNSQQLI